MARKKKKKYHHIPYRKEKYAAEEPLAHNTLYDIPITYKLYQPQETYWEAPQPQCATACSWADTQTEPFVITRHQLAQIKALMAALPHKEWLAYFVEDQKDLFVPNQEVSATRVLVKDTPAHLKVKAVIHSHHTMGTFFSSMDEETVNNNHDISIVVSTQNGSLEFLATRKLKLPCGLIKHHKIPVEIESDPVEQDWLSESLNKITEPQPYLNYIQPKEIETIKEIEAIKRLEDAIPE